DEQLIGSMKIHFSEDGESVAEMIISFEQLMTYVPTSAEGASEATPAVAARLYKPVSGRPLKGLAVTTTDGILLAGSGLFLTGERISGNVVRLRFNLGRATFTVANPLNAKYWVLPLTNFVCDCIQSHPELDRHPLRSQPLPTSDVADPDLELS